MISMESGALCLLVDPAAGGSVAALEWQGLPLLRRQTAPGILHSGCFPLVPFSNRIADSMFSFGGRTVTLPANHPSNPDEPAMHGLGWREGWTVTDRQDNRLHLSLTMDAGTWPWAFTAEQSFALDGDTARFTLAITNRADTPMPAGLGFHPYFPRTPLTRLHALHRGEWQVDARRLPTVLDLRPDAIDWWLGQTAASRMVDTVYEQRRGPISILWPEQRLGLTMTPDDDLSCTVVYVPPDGDFLCAEPVSHMTDSLNRPGIGTGMRVLAPGARWEVAMRLTPFNMP